MTKLQVHDEDHRIVHALDFFLHDGYSCIVLELLGPSLGDLVGTTCVDEASFRTLADHLLRSLAFLHANQVLHADIKPCNLAMDRDRCALRLLDFGNSMRENQVSMYYDTFDVQTTRYRAPECVFGVPFSAPIDLWSAGVTLLEIAVGRPVFSADCTTDLLTEWVQFFGSVDATFFREGKYYPVLATVVAKRYGKENGCTREDHDDESKRENTDVNSSWRPRPAAAAIERLLLGLNPDLATPACVDLLASCLEWDPKARTTADGALQHRFFVLDRPGA